MEKIKELFNGETLSYDEFLARLNEHPEITTAYVKAEEVQTLKNQLEAEKATREQENNDFAEKMMELKRDMMIDLALAQAGAKNIKAARALINETAISLENGVLCGMEQQLAKAGKDCPYLFRIANPPAPAASVAAVLPDEKEKWRKEAGLSDKKNTMK